MTNKDYMKMQIEKMHAEAVAEIARQIYGGNFFTAEYADEALYKEDQRYLKAIGVINGISNEHKTVQNFEES